MTYDQISFRFAVPARRGARVQLQGRCGAVVGVRGWMVKVRFDDSSFSFPYDPKELEWLETLTPGPGKVSLER